MQFSPGDLVEIETSAGLAYAQVTHTHPAYPEVVRIVQGLHAERPADLAQFDRRPTSFVAMFPLASALEMRKLVGRKVGTTRIPENHRQFPTFKMPIHDKNGEVVYWWLWEGDGLTYRIDMDGSCDAYPLREVPTVLAFLRGIEQADTMEVTA